MQAQLANTRIFRINEKAFKSAPLPLPYTPICKEIVGFGPALNVAHTPHDVAAVFAAPPPAPGAGVVPPPALQFLLDTNSALTIDQIKFLCRWYNHNMGILNGDDAGTRNQKLKVYICGRS